MQDRQAVNVIHNVNIVFHRQSRLCQLAKKLSKLIEINQLFKSSCQNWSRTQQAIVRGTDVKDCRSL